MKRISPRSGARLALLTIIATGCVTSARAADASSSDAPNATPDIIVTARRLDSARDAIQPSLGAATYTIGQSAIAAQAKGANISLNELLLQAPGVSQDSYGAVHVRNEHANLQYRLNGVIIPEGIGGFGQALDTRIADSVSLLTGALPAQYGYRTAGVVNLTTKSGALKDAADLNIYGGSHGTVQPSIDVQGAKGSFSYFVSGNYLRNDVGIENVVANPEAIHDRTEQEKIFAYVSQIFGENTRASALFGLSVGTFQIPTASGAASTYVLNGTSNFDSARLDLNQRELNAYSVVALQHSHDEFNIQLAPFIRYSRTRFIPDPNGGDLILTGVADRTRLSSLTGGVQVDASYKLGEAHTVRAGLFFSADRTTSDVSSRVFALTGEGAQLSDQPLTILDSSSRTGYIYGIYLQDEWEINDQLTLNYGARFDRVTAFTREQQLSPRVNLVYKPYDKTTFHFGYARNFTPPPQELIAGRTLALFSGTTRAAASSGNDVVRAEREHYVDAGLLVTLLPGLDLGIDGYYKFKRYLLDDGQFGESLIFSPFNYFSGLARGIELSANYHHGPWTAYGNVALSEETARTIVSSQFFFAPDELAAIAASDIHTDHDQRWTISGGLSYKWRNGWGDLVPAADLVFGSGLRTTPDTPGALPNSTSLPAYTTVNVALAQTFKGTGTWIDGITLRVDVVNLFDEVYQIRDGGGVGVSLPQYGARRGVFGGISKAF